jgi:hypothetical protein
MQWFSPSISTPPVTKKGSSPDMAATKRFSHDSELCRQNSGPKIPQPEKEEIFAKTRPTRALWDLETVLDHLVDVDYRLRKLRGGL